MNCTFTTIESGTCGASGASSIWLRSKVVRSTPGGHAGWATTMRHKVLCPEHRAKGIAEGWITHSV